MKYLFAILSFAVAGCWFAGAMVALADDDFCSLEERAIQLAASRVEPSVIKIELIGTAGKSGELQVGAGPTTGLIVSPDGYIVASEFGFQTKPESILVTLPGHPRAGARLVATDASRKLVLLKVETDTPLPVPEAAPADQIRIGQTAIALGRGYDDQRANVSLGIVSAVDRIWNKAIQTDAKISPNNYGGPLVDLSGRVLGILTSLGPDMMQGGGEALYDGGIGFAVPLEHILKVLPRWKSGDLKSGVLGISLKGTDQFSLPAEIAAARAGSPAFHAGLRTGDIIVEAGGKLIARQAQLKHQLGPLYAGDKLQIVATRGKDRQRIEAEVQLVDQLPPYEFPAIGILPQRPVAGKPEGLFVRYTMPTSPAAAAGIEPGDQIISFAGTKIDSATTLAEKLAELVPEAKAVIEIRRKGQDLKLDLVLGRISDETPESLPPAYGTARPAAKDEPRRGIVPVKLAEFENEAFAYVPDTYRSEIPHGLVLWFSPPAQWNQQEIIERWKPLCEKLDLILLAPKAKEKAAWQPAEVKFARRAADEIAKAYEIDARRVAAHGHEGGGTIAYLLALGNPDLFRGVAVVESALPAGVKLPETNPVGRLLVWSAQSKHDANAAKSIEKLRELKYPVTSISLGDSSRYLNADELNQLGRWLDSLDRL
jgi:serine protease Do